MARLLSDQTRPVPPFFGQSRDTRCTDPVGGVRGCSVSAGREGEGCGGGESGDDADGEGLLRPHGGGLLERNWAGGCARSAAAGPPPSASACCEVERCGRWLRQPPSAGSADAEEVFDGVALDAGEAVALLAGWVEVVVLEGGGVVEELGVVLAGFE